LQHVLPKGFVKVRYYGLFSPGQRSRLKQARALLEAQAPPPAAETKVTEPAEELPPQAPALLCPQCGQPLRWQQKLPPARRQPP
jgi:hypothetical protein